MEQESMSVEERIAALEKLVGLQMRALAQLRTDFGDYMRSMDMENASYDAALENRINQIQRELSAAYDRAGGPRD